MGKSRVTFAEGVENGVGDLMLAVMRRMEDKPRYKAVKAQIALIMQQEGYGIIDKARRKADYHKKMAEKAGGGGA